MHTFEWIIGLLLAAMLLSAAARRFGIPYPTFLAIGGVALAFIPGTPNWTLEPELALAVFLAPVLLDAAFDTSLRELRENWLPVGVLVVAAVAVTTLTVAIVVRWMVPDIPWAAAVALGAIVAPPDAAAAAAILRTVRIPHQILKILEGESLLNDASALLVYRVAVSAAMASSLNVRDVAPVLLFALIGSLVAGYGLARVTIQINARIEDVPSAVIMQFAGTFTVWILAERLGLSGILTIVVYAITIARSAPGYSPARIRVPSYAVWESTVFVLNVMAFVLIGMQLRPVWDGLDGAVRGQFLSVAATVLTVVIFTRIAWVMSNHALVARKIAPQLERPQSDKASRSVSDMASPSVKGSILISWCGMRGIVSLAAAFALPEQFPYRGLILLTAFVVVLGSLVVQGLTLRPLLALLDLRDNDPVAREVGKARSAAYRAALATIDGDQSTEARLLRDEYEALLQSANEHPEGEAPNELPADPLRRRAIDAARETLFEARRSGEIGDDAFHQLEEEFDWAELSAGSQRAAR